MSIQPTRPKLGLSLARSGFGNNNLKGKFAIDNKWFFIDISQVLQGNNFEVCILNQCCFHQ